jgi:hypothetical protein
MTARDGYPCEMDAFALDARTAERLMLGSVDTADAPPEYRAVAGVLQALREALETRELAGEAAAVERIATVVVLERQVRAMRRPLRSSLRMAGLAAAAAVGCALPLTGGLASAGALPEPAQDLASTVFGTVGISVPTGGQDPADDMPPSISPPTPPSTTGSGPGTTAATGTTASTGAGGPGPEDGKSLPVASPPTPGNGQGDPNAPGANPPNEADREGGPNGPNGPSGGGKGNGQGR